MVLCAFVVGFSLSAEVPFLVGGEAVYWFRGVGRGCGVGCGVLCVWMVCWERFLGSMGGRQR